MSEQPTPETAHALVALLDRKGTLFKDNAPEELVTLCRRLERERNELRSDLEFRRGLFQLQEQQLNDVRKERDALQEQLNAAIMLGKMQERRHERELEQVRLASAAQRMLGQCRQSPTIEE